jgi:hypothetical protein
MFTSVGDLNEARYGHCSVFVGGSVFILGGFAHPDLEDTEPITLTSCEKFDDTEGTWSLVTPLNHAVAYAGAC